MYKKLPLKSQVEVVSWILGGSICRVKMHPVTFNLVWDKDLRGVFDREEPPEFLDKESIEKWKWDTVVFPGITKMEMYSLQPGNDDSRGGGCGDMGFKLEDFKWTVTSKEGITLRQVTEAAYRLKGSKYDWWYELFYGIKLKKTVNQEISLLIDFGYGS